MAGWHQDLFGCFDDCGGCLLSYFCPCYVFGSVVADSGTCCCGGCCGTICGILLFFIPLVNCCVRGFMRSNVRAKYGIQAGCCEDWCTLCFCQCCALAQEYHQCKVGLSNRGGAIVVVNQQVIVNQPVGMAPPGQQVHGQIQSHQPHYPPQNQQPYPQQGQYPPQNQQPYPQHGHYPPQNQQPYPQQGQYPATVPQFNQNQAPGVASAPPPYIEKE